MKNSLPVFRVGTRSSKLARIQTAGVIRHLDGVLKEGCFEAVPFSSPGDRDQSTDLRESPSDFFTRDLDEAIATDHLDLAVHSAKDMPERLPDGIDWCWLPWREDPADVLVLPAGKQGLDSVPSAPRIGISSARREVWCKTRFPGAQMVPVRGDIESRLAQLDDGRYDLLVMAAAALIRLDLQERIAERIPLDELQVPDGQGVLSITFRANDNRLLKLRRLFVKPVVFAGGGAGRAGTCTLETAEELRKADVCLCDALLDHALLQHLKPGARLIHVGKRCGSGGQGQATINTLLADYARRGARVLRLKGGDPGVFGRLAEEVEVLEALHLPYRVLPGMSSLMLATTGTGMLLTRRGEARGFSVMTPRAEGGKVTSVGTAARSRFPQVFFMATKCVQDIVSELQGEGLSPDTPAAMVFEAGSAAEAIIRGTVRDIGSRLPESDGEGRPGLLIVGETAGCSYRSGDGALAGCRVLLTCSEAMQAEAAAFTYDRGGIPLPFPAIRMEPVPSGISMLRDASFNWLILTSPSAVHATIAMLKAQAIDVRRLPPILVCGAGTERTLAGYGLHAAARPDCGFGAESLLALARSVIKPGQRVLRLRSDAAGETMAKELTALGAVVTDSVIVRNVSVKHEIIPPFDAVLFASRSAVVSLLDGHEALPLKGKRVAAIGQPTADELERRGIAPVIVGSEATIASAIEAMAAECIRCSLLKEMERAP